MVEEVRFLSKRFDVEDGYTLDGYERTGGYRAVRKALEMEPTDIINVVKDSGLRGRGGAGFSTGMKWSFMPAAPVRPSYFICNADESEPGTYKDRWLLERDPHLLIEGIIIACLAIRSEHSFIYIRGEYEWPARRLGDAIVEAYERGYLGDDVFGTGRRVHITVHRGAGAYIAGEESALLDSLEGRRGFPRLRPPYPAQSGLYASPTTVNNVETICSVPGIIEHGAEWYRQWGTEDSTGTKLVCVSGEVRIPRVFEVAQGTPLRAIVEELCGGMIDDRPVKFFVPGGSSVRILPGDKLDVGLDFESMQEADSMLGTAALMVFSDRTCTLDAVLNWTQFYEHESCGKCTPCREGTFWLTQILTRLETGLGRRADIDIVEDACRQIEGRSFCALGDGAAQPPLSAIKYFRDEWEAHVEERGCPLGATPRAERVEPLFPFRTSEAGTIEPPRARLPLSPPEYADTAAAGRRGRDSA
ncbi:MAG TPA: NADH-quinone oxidoreductase subunit NuoF [Nitriliruptorales bacterium]|nr:NADH-quinone oxidoreductase subunit NuoF [Nitriliruptorales bacterium]